MTPSITKVYRHADCWCTEWHILFTVVLDVIMVNVVGLRVVAPFLQFSSKKKEKNEKFLNFSNNFETSQQFFLKIRRNKVMLHFIN
jgi:hypothetical protein